MHTLLLGCVAMSYVMLAKGVSCVTNIDRYARIAYSDIDAYSWFIIGDNRDNFY